MQPDYGRLHQELRRKGMTLMLLWEEHRADYADRQTYGYTQFCENYRRFAKQLKRSMRQVHRAGEKLFIDYAGPTIGLTDGTRAHIFVAALAGVMAPLTLERLGRDPAVSSSVFVTFVTDLMGFLSFLGLASIILL